MSDRSLCDAPFLDLTPEATTHVSSTIPSNVTRGLPPGVNSLVLLFRLLLLLSPVLFLRRIVYFLFISIRFLRCIVFLHCIIFLRAIRLLRRRIRLLLVLLLLHPLRLRKWFHPPIQKRITR